jgi:PPOX class probable F420-dependent enzyme
MTDSATQFEAPGPGGWLRLADHFPGAVTAEYRRLSVSRRATRSRSTPWRRRSSSHASRYSLHRVSSMAYNDAPVGWWRAFVAALPARTAKLAVVRADGSPHVSPVWVELDGDDIVFMTGANTVKGKAMARDPRVSLCFDDERPPFHFVTITGEVSSTSTDPAELLAWGTRIAARYMGQELAEQYGLRNAVPPEMLVRITPTNVIAKIEVAH